MVTSPALQPSTRILARILGPYLVVVPLLAVARGTLMTDIVANFTASPVWAWVTGAFVLLAGLAVVAVHPYWRGAPAVIVSVTGWLMVTKGLFLLALPQSYLEATASAIGVGIAWWAIESCAAFVGLYLAYAGWAPSRQVQTPAPDSTTDLPRAA